MIKFLTTKISSYALLFLTATVICNTAVAQRITTTPQRTLNKKTVVALKDIKSIGTFKYTGVDYAAWKNGKNIPTNNMGGKDSLFQTVIDGCESVGYNSYRLSPKKSMVMVSVRVQNRKKYMVTVNYSTTSELKMAAAIQYSSDKENDHNVNSTTETQEFSPAKKQQNSFSFIIEPELSKMGTLEPLAVGYPAVALIQFSIPEIRITEPGKAASDYSLHYLGITVKEIQ